MRRDPRPLVASRARLARERRDAARHYLARAEALAAAGAARAATECRNKARAAVRAAQDLETLAAEAAAEGR
jgi:hypothetical protein